MTQRLDLGQALALAFAHLEAGRAAEARRLSRQLERQRPDLPGLPYLLGLLALAEGQGRKAAQHLARALAQTPGAPPPLLAMARAQALQGRRAEAREAYQRVLAAAPSLAEARAELADLLLADRDAAEAAAQAEQALAARPDLALAHLVHGLSCQALGQPDRAALSLARALDLDPAQGRGHTALAAALRRLKRPAEAAEAAQRAVDLDPAAAAAWLELGMARRDGGDGEAALRAFDRAATLAPRLAEAAWLRAEALRLLGRPQAAEAYRRVLALDPEDRFGAALALARLGAAPMPAQAPEAYLRGLFDQYAEGFDRDLVQGLAYRGPALLAAAIRDLLGNGPFDILDLGCGTGLMGEALKPAARVLAGVDLSPRMVEKAAERGVYQRLEAGDLLPVLERRAAAWDLVTAADVFVYLGDLRPVLTAAARALRPGGAVAFTTERLEAEEGEDCRLGPASRYAHSAAYLRRVAAEAGLAVDRLEEVSTRTEQGRPVPGLLAVLRAPA